MNTQYTFVGRTAELTRIRDAAHRARAGHPWTVVVDGESGIGKTSLLLRAAAELDDFLVLRAGGTATGRHEPFGVLRELTTRLTTGNVYRIASEDTQVAPSIVGADLARAIIAAGRPVALLLDDTQWIDRESAAALRFLLRQLANDRVLLVVGYRPPPADDERTDAGLVAALLADGWRHTYLRLAGLAASEISELALTLYDTRLSTAAVDRIAEVTGGHPLYVQTLLGEAPIAWAYRLDAAPPVPGSLALLLRARVAQLPPATRDLLNALAVLDARAPLTVVTRLAGLAGTGGAYQPAVDAGLIEQPSAGWIAYRHPLVRAAVYEAVPATLRRDLHASAAILVDPGAALAHRVAAAEQVDEHLAVELETAARRHAKRGAHLIAGEHLLQASALSPRVADRQRRMLTACVEFLDALAYQRVHALAEEIERTAPSPLRSYVLGHLFSAEPTREDNHFVNYQHEVLDTVDSAVDGDLSARAALSLAQVYAFTGRWDDAARFASDALTLADDPRLLRRIRSFRSWAIGLAEGPTAGLASLGDLTDRDTDAAGGTELLLARGIQRFHLSDFAGARRDLTTAAGRPNGSATQFWWLGHYHLVLSAYFSGAWDDCQRYAQLILDLAVSEVQPSYPPIAYASMALVPAARGDWDTAAHWVGQAMRLLHHDAPTSQVTPVRYSAALIARAKGDYQAVLDALGDPPTPGWYRLGGGACAVLHAEALIELGRLNEAEAALDTFDTTRAAETAYLRAIGLATRGRLLAAIGDSARARQHYEASLAISVDRSSRLDRALALHWYGSLLRRTDDQRSAIRTLRSARQLFADLGAGPYLERTEAALRRTGRHSPDLSDRERQVAALVQAGMTNREIAAELSVSAKTIEYHLGNIFAKLGVRSRRALRTAVDGRTAAASSFSR